MTTRERHRGRRERRVLTARKINARVTVRRCCIDDAFTVDKGRLAKKLIYRTKQRWEYYMIPSVSTRRKLDTIKSKMEDYNYEAVC